MTGIRLTLGMYTDPAMLDCVGALQAQPSMGTTSPTARSAVASA